MKLHFLLSDLTKYLPIWIPYFLQLAHTAPNRWSNNKGLQDWRHANFSTHFSRTNSCFKCIHLQTHPLKSNISLQHWSICNTSGLLSLHLHLFLAYSLIQLHPILIFPLGLLLCHQEQVQLPFSRPQKLLHRCFLSAHPVSSARQLHQHSLWSWKGTVFKTVLGNES